MQWEVDDEMVVRIWKIMKISSSSLMRYLRTDAGPAAIFNLDMLAYWALALARCTAFASTADTLLKLLAKLPKIETKQSYD